MMPRPFVRALALIAAVIVVTDSARAAEIHALITTAMKAAIDELVPNFERDTGHTVRVSYGPSGGVARPLVGGTGAVRPALVQAPNVRSSRDSAAANS